MAFFSAFAGLYEGSCVRLLDSVRVWRRRVSNQLKKYSVLEAQAEKMLFLPKKKNAMSTFFQHSLMLALRDACV